MINHLKQILREAQQFYPDYLKAHSNKANRILHFIGASFFFVCIGLAIVFQNWLFLPLAICIGYLFPGIGHRFFQHNNSFRSTKPVLCVICATKLYWDTLTFQIQKKMKSLTNFSV